MAATSSTEVRQALKGGVVAGLVGGVAIAFVLLVSTLAQGGNAWVVFKGPGAPFLGDRAVQPGFDGPAVLVGTLSHFAVSIGWGALFGLLCFGLSRGATILAGLGWGLVVWLGMSYLVLPAVGLADMARATPTVRAILDHLAFGLSVGLGFLPFQRAAPRRAGRRLGRPVPT